MNKLLITITGIFLYLSAFTQVYPDKYYVQFTDKNNSPYSISNPNDFLSQRSIDRRERQGIPFDEKDLPVNPSYIQGVKDIGVTIINPTKWLNGVTIETDDPSKVAAIRSLPYVFQVKKSSFNPADYKFEKPYFKNESFIPKPYDFKSAGKSKMFDYGPSYNQIHMLNGDMLHDMGYRGDGMIIAVLDGGFLNANTMPAFDSLWSNGQIIATRDFVKGGEVTFDTHPHGSMVLGTMGGNVPGTLIGTAPKASYMLIRSEDTYSEYLIEEYNWVSAAEYADSSGADIINSSLGYTTFDDPDQDHSYQDMDGNTTPITIGADVAASRGMIVVNSAGNSGSSPWFYIGAPADGDSVFAIGAVDALGDYVFFSSRGPSYDGRIKPNVAAQGYDTYTADPYGNYGGANGTSFSSPVTAGMIACLWQSHPNIINMELLSAIESSGSQASAPDDFLGFGIPDYYEAMNILTVIDVTNGHQDIVTAVSPNPFTDDINISFTGLQNMLNGDLNVNITDVTGKVVFSKQYIMDVGQEGININELENLPSGFYFIALNIGNRVFFNKLVKN